MPGKPDLRAWAQWFRLIGNLTGLADEIASAIQQAQRHRLAAFDPGGNLFQYVGSLRTPRVRGKGVFRIGYCVE